MRPDKVKKVRKPLPKAPWLDEEDKELDRCSHGRFMRTTLSMEVHQALCRWR